MITFDCSSVVNPQFELTTVHRFVIAILVLCMYTVQYSSGREKLRLKPGLIFITGFQFLSPWAEIRP